MLLGETRCTASWLDSAVTDTVTSIGISESPRKERQTEPMAKPMAEPMAATVSAAGFDFFYDTRTVAEQEADLQAQDRTFLRAVADRQHQCDANDARDTWNFWFVVTLLVIMLFMCFWAVRWGLEGYRMRQNLARMGYQVK